MPISPPESLCHWWTQQRGGSRIYVIQKYLPKRKNSLHRPCGLKAEIHRGQEEVPCTGLHISLIRMKPQGERHRSITVIMGDTQYWRDHDKIHQFTCESLGKLPTMPDIMARCSSSQTDLLYWVNECETAPLEKSNLCIACSWARNGRVPHWGNTKVLKKQAKYKVLGLE